MFIVARDVRLMTLVYSGFVSVGDGFALEDPVSMDFLEADTSVKIYSDSSQSPSALIQEFQFPTRCSSPLFPKEILGGTQIECFVL